ncbi:pseudouridine synthase [Abyssicoccus albus]|uniref:Pseudouridine synthase n=1 Tax=Abyssicoccus albus TaxID=1817405 RepID=A0A3N5BSK3_9BACL|nr:pseudouridine synthase [Abyssicoccus albus]RPF58050.1 23S rRNA pseudouridine2605 synthase [Abyssicoccus albus]
MNHKERVQKIIANSGITSRRKAEQYILDGRVSVNGQIITELGVKAGSNDRVEVDGVPIEKEQPIYILMYKPRGVVSTVEDEHDRKTVIDLLEGLNFRIYPVGRLDYETTGLLLLTNDGDLTYQLTHPKFKVMKKYLVTLDGILLREEIKTLEKGIMLDDGMTAKCKVKVIQENKKENSSQLELTIHEGRNRQVRRMIEYFNYNVKKLKRIQYAQLTLKGLKEGESRALTPHEVKQLKELT